MESKRLPRFKRVAGVPRIKITDRDRQILRLIHEHRFLRSSHIIDLLGGSPQSILRRLQLLYHNGLLERPHAQIGYFHHGGSRHMVYGLGKSGGAMLRREGEPNARRFDWGEKNRKVGGVFLDHALLVSDVMVAIELACRKVPGVRLVPQHEIALPMEAGAKRLSFHWKVAVNGQPRLGVIPDRVFALDITRYDGEIGRAYFFLEADRGTMPVTRKSMSQSSFHRKLVAYEATWSQALHRKLFGFHRFRVLTVTTSADRVNSLVEACSKLRSGHGLFLFTDLATIQKHGNILTVPWNTARRGESNRLVD